MIILLGVDAAILMSLFAIWRKARGIERVRVTVIFLALCFVNGIIFAIKTGYIS